jgi:hypothetical protein
MADGKLFPKEVVASYDLSAQGRPVYLTMAGYADFATKLIITSLGAQAAVNYQLNYAFNDDAYAYIFGDRMTIATLSGIAMSDKSGCTTGDKSSADPANFVNFYKTYKLGTATSAAKLAFSTLTVEGYFISMSVALLANREDAYQFTFQFLGRINA